MSYLLLTARNVSRTYTEGGLKTEVLRDVNLDMYARELTAIVGKSGSGKSTLLHILGTLDTQSGGEILFNNQSLRGLSGAERADFRNKSLGFVYQFHHLLGDFSALENVMLPLIIARSGKARALNRARGLLARVGLEDRLDYRPSELSGGERQRVAIARALVNQPELVLADEPTGNLDAQNAEQIFKIFRELTRDEGAAVVMVTHDGSLAAQCDRVYAIEDGRIHV